MITRSILIQRPRGYTKVLRLATIGRRVLVLYSYRVHPDAAMCQVCGCTDWASCSPPCAWANLSRTICTRCAEVNDGS